METLRVGFVGLGGICRFRHVPGLQAIDGIEIVAVANRTQESTETAARDFEIPQVYYDWQSLIEANDIDVVFVGAYPDLHADVTVAALESGKHVFCQARMATDLEQAQRMYDAAQASDRVAGLCPVPIGLNIDTTMRKRYESGGLGEVRLVRVQSLTNAFMWNNEPLHWRKDHRRSGLNMHTLGMYIEVIHRWFGWTHSVSAQQHTYIEQMKDKEGKLVPVVVPDLFLLNTTLESGIPVQYTIGSAVNHGHDRIEIYGTKQTVVYDVNEDRLASAAPDELLGEATLARKDMQPGTGWTVEADFIRAIREGTPYHPDFHDGIKYMEVVQAAHESALKRDAVNLD
jgi:predicted dehydrogenase